MVTKTKISTEQAMMSMDSLYRHFVVSDKIIDSYEKNYRHIEQDIKLLRFAQGSMGTTSDAYILYALAVMGTATKESISNFLSAYRRLHTDLQIYDPDDSEGLRRRLQSFSSNGIIFRHSYQVETISEKNHKALQETTILYTIEDAMLNFINQKLGTRVKLQKWVAAKPLEELIGWGACSFVATSLCNRPELLDIRQNTFYSKACGTVILPAEVKLNNGENDTYVAHCPSFLHFNKSRQTEDMYESSKLMKILEMRDYLEFRGGKGQDPYVVIVCENTKDAEAMKELIDRTQALQEYTQRLYFTSEGTFRADNIPIEKKYFQIERDTKGLYKFIPGVPNFIRS